MDDHENFPFGLQLDCTTTQACTLQGSIPVACTSLADKKGHCVRFRQVCTAVCEFRC
jgi:hypothetical protein